MFDFTDDRGASRRCAPPAQSQPIVCPPAELRLSQAAAEFLDQQRRRGIAARTVDDYRQALWYVIEHVGCDAPVRELGRGLPAQWLDWLRATPAARRRPKSLPHEITPGSVSAFLAWPPARAQPGELRSEQTVGRFWRHSKGFFKSLGLDVDLGRQDRPNLALPPPLVPGPQTVARWWAECLAGPTAPPHPSAGRRQRVVLMQALVLLTGMRLGEALAARLDDVEGHWLLLRPEAVKTRRPRILYLSSQALAIAAALRTRYNRPTLWRFDDQPLAGWSQSVSAWQALARKCRAATHGEQKRHQALRRAMSTWLHRRDPVAESAQLGHGSGVVFQHYLDVLRRLPALLDRFGLPAIEGFAWPEKIRAERGVPARLYEEFRRLVSRRRKC